MMTMISMLNWHVASFELLIKSDKVVRFLILDFLQDINLSAANAQIYFARENAFDRETGQKRSRENPQNPELAKVAL